MDLNLVLVLKAIEFDSSYPINKLLCFSEVAVCNDQVLVVNVVITWNAGCLNALNLWNFT